MASDNPGAVQKAIFVIPAQAGIQHLNFRFSLSPQFKIDSQVMD
jgi:hypothetical protein